MTRAAFAAVVAVALVAAGVLGLGCARDETPNYYADVEPLLAAKCVGCHHDGGIAPFALDSYAAAEKYAEPMATAVALGKMPPWPADAACNDYLYDRSLTDAQIATLVAWAERAAPEGDAGNPGPPLGPPPASLSRVDLTLALGAPYTPAADREDEYRCFVLDWPEAAPRFVAGLRARPGEARIVHHVIVFAADPAHAAEVDALDAADPAPGYACYGGAGFSQARWLGSWVPGSESKDYPAGTGVRVDPGSKVVVQIHYNMAGSPPLPDRTELDVRLETTVAHEARIQPWTNPGWIAGNAMKIAAGDADASYSFALDPTLVLSAGAPLTVYASALHMHTLGKNAKLHIERANGDDTCLVSIPEWDFHWQRMYFLAEPEHLAPGDRMAVECHWDNSAGHQPFVDGVQVAPKDVFWGEGTSDEMCLGTFYFTTP